MNSIAILKHVSEKNGDYSAAQTYLLFEHDPTTQKVLHDENGLMIMRKGVIQTGINCDPFTFNTECTELNRAYGKNQGRNDVKAHHYIISFDPKDTDENGLTPQRAHSLGLEFARKFFAGHQVLVVTHPDGHNKTGNIHVHIVLNSLRKDNVAWQPFMEKQIDTQAGFKHHQTRDLLSHMQDFVNELCEREHLYTVDFSLPADRKMTDLEYKAKQHSGEETIKDKLRSAIDTAVSEAGTVEDFSNILKRNFGIELKVSRGVWSYVHPEREKPIRARSLGRIYGKYEIEKRISGISDIDLSRPEYRFLPRIFLIRSNFRLVTDIQNCVKAKQSLAYARKVSISNLQQTARAVAYIQEKGIGTMDALNTALDAADKEYRSCSVRFRENRVRIAEINEDIHYLGQYLSGKKVYSEFLKSQDKGLFRIAHKEEIDKYESAADYIKKRYSGASFPRMSELKNKKSLLMKEQTQTKSALTEVTRRRSSLQAAKRNIDALFAERKPHSISGPSI